MSNNKKTVNDDLQLVAQDEEVYEIVEEEEFEPDMILVPVRCSACNLLMYTSEKNIGKWMICPDCERKNEIRKPPDRFRYITEISKEGILEVKPITDPPTPKREKVTDYRTLETSVDYGKERLPVINLGEVIDDPLEKVLEGILKNKKKKPESTTKEKQVSTTTATTISPTAAGAPTATGVAPQNPKQPPVFSAPLPPSQPISPESPTEPVVKIEKEENSSPWALNHFFYPFFDPVNRFRLLFGLILGFIAFIMTFNLLRFFGQFLFSADPRGPDYVYQFHDILLFILEYVTAFAPLTVWLVHLITCGMTLFDKTRFGVSRIHRWEPFRSEMALQTMYWILVVLAISPFPGVIISFGIHLACGNVPWRLPAIPISIYIMFPLLLLSVVKNDSGLELYNRLIWKSLFRNMLSWFFYFLFTLPLLTIFGISIFIGFITIINCIIKPFIEAQIFFIVTSAVLCFLITTSVYLYFRLLGALAWSIEKEE